MPDQDLTVTFRPQVEGLGEKEEYTIGMDTAKQIVDLVEADVKSRYEDIPDDADVRVLELSSPNHADLYITESDE